MRFDEEGDHYMSKADFAIMCDELKNAVSQRDELLAALKVVKSENSILSDETCDLVDSVIARAESAD